MFRSISNLFKNLLLSPKKVFFLCTALLLVLLTVDGTVYRLWQLHQNQERIKSKLFSVKKAQKDLDTKINKANDPDFLEWQARERFHMVGEDELVFIFTGEEEFHLAKSPK